MYKKITQFIICLLSVVILAQSLPVFAAEQTDDLQKTSTLLNALDISLGNREFTQDTKITRAETATILLKFMNIPVTGSNQTYYTDVDSDTFGKNEIAYATDLGLSNGYGDGTYRPEQLVTYGEALTMTVRALGYGPIINDINDVNDIIRKIGLLKGIKGIDFNNTVSYAVMQAILYNALSCDVAEIKNSQNDYVFEKTALEKFFDVYRCSGVVTATDVTALAGYTVANQSMIRIDNEEYYANSGSISEYLGQRVDVYYKENKNDHSTILYVYNVKSDVNSFKDEDIEKFSGTEYKAEENNRTKTYKLASNYSLIYNGKLLDDHSETYYMVPKNGSVTLVDTTSDGKYDVVFVYDYKTAGVSKIDADNTRIYDKIYSTNYNYGVSNLKVYDPDGYILEVGDIKTDSILLIAESIDKDSIIIRVSDRIVTGNVESVSSDNKVKIDGTVYDLSIVFGDTENSYIKAGTSTSFRLDALGKIVCTVAGESSENGKYYYLLNASIDKDTGKDRVVVKLLNSDNETGGFYIAEKAKIDSKTYKKADAMLAKLQKTADDGTTVTRRSPVIVQFNEDNEISSIDLPYENGQPESGESDNSLHKYASYFNDPIVGVQNNNETNVLSGRIAYKPSETIVFLVPTDGNIDTADESEFRGAIYNKQYSAYSFMKCDAYTDKYPEIYADVLVSRASDPESMQTDGGRFLVSEITIESDEDDIPREKYTLLEGTTVYEYFLADGVDTSNWNVEAGDVVRIATNTKEELIDLAVYYDASEDKVENDQYMLTTATNVFHTGEQYMVGGIYDINGGFMKFFPANVTPDRNTEFILGNVNKFYSAVIFHRNRKTVENFDMSQITTYKEAGSAYTRVVMIYQIGQPRWAYYYVD